MSKKTAPATYLAPPMLIAALDRLVFKYAPALVNPLLCNERIPVRHQDLLVEWIAILASGSPAAAFQKDVLIEVLHSLNIALLSSYTYAPYIDEANEAPEGRVHLDLFDAGDAELVEDARTAVAIVIASLHGEEGVAAVDSAENELRKLLDAISRAAASAV